MRTEDEQRRSVEPVDPVTWSLPSVPASKVPRPPARAWVHGVGVLLVVASFALFVTGLVRGERSMDVPWGEVVRYGLMGNGLPRMWWCREGHEHWSAPYWLASLVLLLGSLVVWLVLARRFPRR